MRKRLLAAVAVVAMLTLIACLLVLIFLVLLFKRPNPKAGPRRKHFFDRTCPNCRELIDRRCTVCPHCARETHFSPRLGWKDWLVP